MTTKKIWKMTKAVVLGLLLIFMTTLNVNALEKHFTINNLPEQIEIGVEIGTYLDLIDVTLYDTIDNDYGFYRINPFRFWGELEANEAYEDNKAIFIAWADGSFDSVTVNGENFNIVEISHPEKLKLDENVSSGAYYSKMVDCTVVVVAYDEDLKVSFELSDGKGLVQPTNVAITVPTKIKVGEEIAGQIEKTVISPDYFWGTIQDEYIFTYDKDARDYTELDWLDNLPETDHYYYKIEGIIMDEILSLAVNGVKLPLGSIDGNEEYLDLLDALESFVYLDDENHHYNVLLYYNEDGELQLPEYPEPKIVETPKDTFVLKTKDELVFKIDLDMFLFEKVLINGKELDAKHYSVKPGSTIITLNNDYLNSLNEGKYEIEFVFESGSVKSSFEISTLSVPVVPVEEVPVPKTADYINYYIVLSFISLISLLALSFYKKDYIK